MVREVREVNSRKNEQRHQICGRVIYVTTSAIWKILQLLGFAVDDFKAHSR